MQSDTRLVNSCHQASETSTPTTKVMGNKPADRKTLFIFSLDKEVRKKFR